MASGRPAILEFFDGIERTLPVADWSVGGLRVWPILRNLLGFALVSKADLPPQSQVLRYTGARRIGQILASLGAAAKARWTDRRRNARVPAEGVDVLFLTASTTRFFKVDGEWYNPYSDSFIKHLRDEGLSSLVLETTPDGRFRIPRFDGSILIQDKLFLRAARARLFASFGAGEERLEGFGEFERRYAETLKEDAGALRPLLRFRTRQTLFFRDYYRSWLRRLRPGAALIPGYSSTETMGLIAACREAGIASYDIQHGVQGAEHFAYRAWTALPKEGYELLPSRFWCWGEEEARAINRWGEAAPGRHVAFRGGNPCLEIYGRDGRPVATALAGGARPAVRVLYTLQAAYALPDFVVEAMRRSPPEWSWWLRVHPQYWETREPIRDSLRRAGLSGFVIDEASDYPLASVLTVSDVHVTDFSSSVLEAADLGVPSVVVSDRGRLFFASQIASGVAVHAATADDLLRAIEAQRKKKDELAPAARGRSEIFAKAVSVLAAETRAARRGTAGR
jgi:hypothetical protein